MARQGKIYRTYDIGNLISLIMLDTRIVGRDESKAYMRGDLDFRNKSRSVES